VPTSSAKNGVARRRRHEEREKRSRMANKVTTIEARTIIIVWGIDGQMGRVSRAGPRHGPFNSAWVMPARASCRAWTVASARSAGLARHDCIYFILQKNRIYICTLKILEHGVFLVKWLHSVSPALRSSGCRFEPHLLHHFLTFYADLTKLTDDLTAQPGPTRSAGRPSVLGPERAYAELCGGDRHAVG
jgi:hypothetical protein